MKLKAFAKVNLTLDICGKREDGYHLLDSLMQSVSLYDTVTVEKDEKISVECSNDEFSGEKNIAFSAAKSFFDSTGIEGGAYIHIEKRIPAAAGLGGSSADAAAVIIALDKIYQTRLKTEKLMEIGLSVGADVPFCIMGGTARVMGIGEACTVLPQIRGFYAVIAKNGNKTSTKDMYRALDNGEKEEFAFTERAVEAVFKGESVADFVGNAFARVCGLYQIDELLKKYSPDAVTLSGSGPCVVALFSDRQKANDAQGFLKSKNITAFTVQPVAFGTQIE